MQLRSRARHLGTGSTAKGNGRRTPRVHREKPRDLREGMKLWLSKPPPCCYPRPVIMHWIAPSEEGSRTDSLENRVTTFAAAALGRIATLEAQVHCFRRTRDLLLPRLLSSQSELASASANGASSNQPGATPQLPATNIVRADSPTHHHAPFITTLRNTPQG